MRPAELYESYEVRPADLKARSKCPLPPTINIVNVETREEDYVFSHGRGDTFAVNPKELTNGIVEYLKYGYERSQIKVDKNSSKIIRLSFKDAKWSVAFFAVSGMIQIKVDIPETKYSEIYEATDKTYDGFKALVHAIHDVTRRIIDDHAIQDYILCK